MRSAFKMDKKEGLYIIYIKKYLEKEKYGNKD